MYSERDNYFNVAGGEPSVGDNFTVNGFDVTVGGVGSGQATLIVKSPQNLKQANSTAVDAIEFAATVDVLGLSFLLPANADKNTVLDNAGFSGSYWTSVQKGARNTNGEIATIGQSGVQTVSNSEKHQVFVFANTPIVNLKDSVEFYSNSSGSDTAQTTTIPEVPPTPTSGLTDDEGKPISIFSDVESKFTQYLELVDQVAQELTTAKGELNTLNQLCGKDESDENACTTAAQLTTYVQELQGDLENLTNENTTLDAFRNSVISKLSDIQDEDGESIITADSTDEQIITALTDKISGLEAKIVEKDNSIQDLKDDISALEGDIAALEDAVTTALTTLSADATPKGETAILRVKDALNEIDNLYDNLETARKDLADDLNDIKNAVMFADFDTDTLDGAISDTYQNDDGTMPTVTAKQYVQDYIEAIQGYIDGLNSDNAIALSDAEDAYDAAVLNLENEQNSALAAQLVDYNASITAEALKLTTLQGTVSGYQTNLDEAINSLVALGDLDSDEVINLSNLASQWETALKNYNSKVQDYDTLLEEKGNLQISSTATSQELEGVKSELLIANNTISSQESRLTEMLESLNEVNTELGNFKTLSNTMEDEISSLENVLTELGYTPVTQTESFNGGGISDIFGAEPTEIQHLLFRGIEARKAYLNMSGDGKNDFSSNDVDTLDFNADGSDIKTNGLLKIGLIAGLLYVGSKLLKK